MCPRVRRNHAKAAGAEPARPRGPLERRFSAAPVQDRTRATAAAVWLVARRAAIKGGVLARP